MRVINSTKIKILNGTASFFISTTKSLLSENCEVIAMLPKKNIKTLNNLENIKNKNLKIILLSNNKIIAIFQMFINSLIFQPDFILTHDYDRWFFYIAKILRIKSVCSIFGIGEIKFHKFKNLIDIVLPAKKYQLKAIKEYYPEIKMLYFPYCVDFSEKEIKKNKQKKFTLGCLGVMEARKGFKELILACDILKNKNNIDFQLLLGGNGIEKKDLEKLVEEKNLQDVCKFVGYVYDKDDFYSKLDLFCFTSYIEDIGFIVPEAISHKVPIIGNSIGFVSDVLDDNDLTIVPSDNIDNPEKSYKKGRFIKAWFELENNKYRFETKPLKPPVLADKIEYAMNNYSEIFKKAENAHRKIKNNYIPSISVKNLLEIIK